MLSIYSNRIQQSLLGLYKKYFFTNSGLKQTKFIGSSELLSYIDSISKPRSNTFFKLNLVRIQVRAVEEILKQTEEDADKEILEMKTKYEKLLRTEREANVRMRGESGIVKKKLQTLVRIFSRVNYNK